MNDLVFRGKHLSRERPLIMAIVNRTPDSFYAKARSFTDDDARSAVERAVDEGADIIDIGGVKAGPGSDVDVQEELRRVLPLVSWARECWPEVVISVDTWRAGVAREVCEAGADLINDTWQGADPGLVGVAAEFGAGLVCSHTDGASPRSSRPHRARYSDVVASVRAELVRLAEHAVSQGVPREGIVIDPTHDFAKNTWHGLELLRRLDELVASGWPVLMSLSNKDFIGETLGVPPEERLAGTLASTAIATHLGAAIFRAHEVAETKQTCEMAASIRGDRPPTRVLRGLA